MKLQKFYKKHGIELEYMPPYTPQMNGAVERCVAVLLNGPETVLSSRAKVN